MSEVRMVPCRCRPNLHSDRTLDGSASRAYAQNSGMCSRKVFSHETYADRIAQARGWLALVGCVKGLAEALRTLDGKPTNECLAGAINADRTLETVGWHGAGWFWCFRSRGLSPERSSIGPLATRWLLPTSSIALMVALNANTAVLIVSSGLSLQ